MSFPLLALSTSTAAENLEDVAKQVVGGLLKQALQGPTEPMPERAASINFSKRKSVEADIDAMLDVCGEPADNNCIETCTNARQKLKGFSLPNVKKKHWLGCYQAYALATGELQQGTVAVNEPPSSSTPTNSESNSEKPSTKNPGRTASNIQSVRKPFLEAAKITEEADLTTALAQKYALELTEEGFIDLSIPLSNQSSPMSLAKYKLSEEFTRRAEPFTIATSRFHESDSSFLNFAECFATHYFPLEEIEQWFKYEGEPGEHFFRVLRIKADNEFEKQRMTATFLENYRPAFERQAIRGTVKVFHRQWASLGDYNFDEGYFRAKKHGSLDNSVLIPQKCGTYSNVTDTLTIPANIHVDPTVAEGLVSQLGEERRFVLETEMLFNTETLRADSVLSARVYPVGKEKQLLGRLDLESGVFNATGQTSQDGTSTKAVNENDKNKSADPNDLDGKDFHELAKQYGSLTKAIAAHFDLPITNDGYLRAPRPTGSSMSERKAFREATARFSTPFDLISLSLAGEGFEVVRYLQCIVPRVDRGFDPSRYPLRDASEFERARLLSEFRNRYESQIREFADSIKGVVRIQHGPFFARLGKYNFETESFEIRYKEQNDTISTNVRVHTLCMNHQPWQKGWRDGSKRIELPKSLRIEPTRAEKILEKLAKGREVLIEFNSHLDTNTFTTTNVSTIKLFDESKTVLLHEWAPSFRERK